MKGSIMIKLCMLSASLLLFNAVQTSAAEGEKAKSSRK